MLIKKLTLLLTILAFVIYLKTVSFVLADWKMDYKGNLVYFSSQVLGEEDETTDEKKEEKSEEKKEEEKKTEPEKTEKKEEIKNENIKEINISAESEDDNKIKVEVETENDELMESEQEEFEIENENEIENESIKISTGEAENELEIEKNKVKVKTNFPLSIDPATNELFVNTPAGKKIVTILPDDAASVVNKLGIVDKPETEAEIKIETEGNQLIYKVKGKKKEKFLGFFEIELEKEINVSAETGALLQTKETLITQILDLLSF